MNSTKRQSMRLMHRCLIYLVRLQLTLAASASSRQPGPPEAGWPTRLIEVGTLIAGISMMGLVIWLRRRS